MVQVGNLFLRFQFSRKDIIPKLGKLFQNNCRGKLCLEVSCGCPFVNPNVDNTTQIDDDVKEIVHRNMVQPRYSSLLDPRVPAR